MNNNVKYGIIGGVVVLFAVALYFLTDFGSDADTASNQNTTTSNTEFNEIIFESGRSGYMTRKLLQSYYPDAEITDIVTPLTENLPFEYYDDQCDLFFYIGEGPSQTRDDTEWLSEFVYQGNVAVVAADFIPRELQSQFFDRYPQLPMVDSVCALNFVHKAYKADTAYRFTKRGPNGNTIEWSYYDIEQLSYDTDVITVSTDQYGNAICIIIQYGDGIYLLHSYPMVFSNNTMLSARGAEYVAKILSELPECDNIYWQESADGYRATTEVRPLEVGQDRFQRRMSSPLQFVLKNSQLKWAFYLLITMLMLYLLFRSKRRQRPIPTLEKNENSSMEFVNTVTQLYYQTKRHDKLVRHKEIQFMSFVKKRYFMVATEANPEFIQRLAKVSGIDEIEIGRIFKIMYTAKKTRSMTDDVLIELHQKMEHFFKNCK